MTYFYENWPFNPEASRDHTSLGKVSDVCTIRSPDGSTYYAKTPRFIFLTPATREIETESGHRNRRPVSFNETDALAVAQLLRAAYIELCTYADEFNASNPGFVEAPPHIMIAPTTVMVVRDLRFYKPMLINKEVPGLPKEDLSDKVAKIVSDTLWDFRLHCNAAMKQTVNSTPTPLSRYILIVDSSQNRIYTHGYTSGITADIHEDNARFDPETNTIHVFDW